MPLLLDIIEVHARTLAAVRAEPRRQLTDDEKADAALADAARIGFCRLGPEGSSALPRLIDLDRQGLLGRTISNDRKWTLALARLGKPIESFAKPENLSGTTEAYHANLRRRLNNFQPDRNCR